MKTWVLGCPLALVLAGCASPVKMYSESDRAASELARPRLKLIQFHAMLAPNAKLRPMVGS